MHMSWGGCWFISHKMSHDGVGRPRSHLWQPRGVAWRHQSAGLREPSSQISPPHPLPSPQAQSWESSGLLEFRKAQAVWGRGATLGCGAICWPSPFRSCGFLWVWGSCPLRPPLPVLVRPEGQDTPPTPQPHPQEARLGGRQRGRCHARRPALRLWPSTPLHQGCSRRANSPGGNL